jgi:short subunit dehydrogenase-like uncharacterized protein
MHGKLMIYGATGYTGTLLAEEAVRRGMRPVLAGRDAAKLTELAGRLGLAETRCFGLGDPQIIAGNLAGIECVLHAAGPFEITGKPMIDACIAAGAHYLDITGEFKIFEYAESRDGAAQAAGVMLMPGVGWDVVPSDCVAAHAAARVADPQSLRLALYHFGGVSRGSVKSGAGIVATGPRARRGGKVVIPDDQQPVTVDFGHGPLTCVPMPMGDIITAWKSTVIPDIETHFAIADGPSFADAVDPEELPDGPSKEERDAGRSRVIATVTAADGTTVRSMIETVSGYSYTGESGIEVASRVLGGDFKPGFQSPASAYGASLATSIGEGVITELD